MHLILIKSSQPDPGRAGFDFRIEVKRFDSAVGGRRETAAGEGRS